MRKSTTAIALALLWAPTNQAFQAQNQITRVSTAAHPTVLAVSAADSTNDNTDNDFNDWESLDRKNTSRKKFGLKPMTPAQFLENDALVQQMAVEQDQRKASAAAERLEEALRISSKPQKNFVPGFLEKMMDNVLPDTCESNWDCEAPKVCCDFGAAKVCCAGGSRRRSYEGEMKLVPVPIDVLPPGSY